MRIVVRYDASFSQVGTWILNDRGTGIRARFKLGEAPERVIDAELRRVGPGGPGRVFASPVDGACTTWMTESSTFGGQLEVPVVLQLSEAPPWIAETLRLW